ncbi:MAG: UPF0179 family protein [Candidatus Lokiarchaeota archaeon]|nr:UPF0179 family protein [Candidatus Lokiarchaeota archaeon]
MSYLKKSRASKVPEQGKKDYLVTLALERNAQVGKEFLHDEMPGACKECPLYQICMKNLLKGRVYVIQGIDDGVRHECPKKLFQGEMVVVKVKEKPLLVTFTSSKIFEGMRLTYAGQNCPEKACKYHPNCDLPDSSLARGALVKCLKILKRIRPECKIGRDLSLIEVSREAK